MKDIVRLSIRLRHLCLVLAVVSCSKKGGTDYGQLQCLDGWPAQPSEVASTSFTAAPSVMGQGHQRVAASPPQSGVAISNDRVVFSAGASVAALDRRTGAQLFVRSTTPGNYFLSAPVVDTQGQIYVQAAANLHAFAPDGTQRWTYALDAATSSEPASGSFVPTLVADAMVLARSLKGDVAVNAAGTAVW